MYKRQELMFDIVWDGRPFPSFSPVGTPHTATAPSLFLYSQGTTDNDLEGLISNTVWDVRRDGSDIDDRAARLSQSLRPRLCRLRTKLHGKKSLSVEFV